MSTTSALRRRALATALRATLAAGILLVVIMGTIDVIVAQSLTATLDGRLQQQLATGRPVTISAALDTDTDFDQPVLTWSVVGGTATPSPGAPPLPASYWKVSGATTATVAGHGFRVAGRDLGPGRRLIAGTSLTSVSDALNTLALTEAGVVVAVLLLVPIIATLVARRVALPVERMRRRQLDFAADASHELRTPLTVIQAEVQLLAEDAGGEVAAGLDRIEGETRRMRRLVDDLLWLARADAEPTQGVEDATDLRHVTEHAVERFRALAQQRGLTLTLDVPDQAVEIEAREEWVDRLVGVLLDNACRYSHPGGEVRAGVAVHERRALISVRDSGPGIDPVERERIFARFHRAEGTGGDGAGLGLAIADSVVRATHGRWSVTNWSGGAEFSVSWRLRHAGGV